MSTYNSQAETNFYLQFWLFLFLFLVIFLYSLTCHAYTTDMVVSVTPACLELGELQTPNFHMEYHCTP
jgi:hypothetical protein